jgi:aspartate/methionine/tyrosine aminotransferase
MHTTVAQRFAPFGTTIFAEMTALAQKFGAVNLGQGFPDFDGPLFVKDAAIEAITKHPNQYAPMGGVPELTETLARLWMDETNIACDARAHVTVTAGCTEAIAAAMLGLVNPGDEVILFEPYYDSYRACVAMAGGVPRFITLKAPEFRFDRAALAAAFTEKTKLILVNTPHNPTGRVFTREELATIAELCVANDVLALTDEVYERLVFDGEHLRLATFPGMAERTLTMSSLGKTFSLTGWKIGWAIGPEEMTRAIRAAHQFLTFAVSTPLQRAAAAALGAPPSYYDALRSSFRAKRDVLCDALEVIGFDVRRPEGGYFAMADFRAIDMERLGLPTDGAPGVDDAMFCKALVERVGVAAIPPSFFYENKREGATMARFAFCKQDETIAEGVRRLNALKR